MKRQVVDLLYYLENAKKETKLYSPMYGDLWLAEVDKKYEIVTCYHFPLLPGETRAILEQEATVSFYKDGTTGVPNFNISAECMLYPNKNKTWYKL